MGWEPRALWEAILAEGVLKPPLFSLLCSMIQKVAVEYPLALRLWEHCWTVGFPALLAFVVQQRSRHEASQYRGQRQGIESYNGIHLVWVLSGGLPGEGDISAEI
jgi:hypothetical protein